MDGCTFSCVINEDRRRFESWVKLESSKVDEDLGSFPPTCTHRYGASIWKRGTTPSGREMKTKVDIGKTSAQRWPLTGE